MITKELIKKKIDELPSPLLREVLDFMEFLRQRKKKMAWLDFDAWAMNLAKKKKFNKLTEQDISAILKTYRHLDS